MLRFAFAILLSPAMIGVAAQSDTGTIAGKVVFTTKVKGAALPSSAYPTRTVGDRQPPSISELRNVVVSIKDAPFRGSLTAKTSELKQDHESFVPHVLAITRGSTVAFPNADPFFHNVFSLSSAASFNLGRYPTGKTAMQVFPKAGIVKVFCNIHSHMGATILVFDHPYFAIPEADGAYELPAIPAGDYTIVGWHDRVGERTVPVKVERGKTTTINMSLPLEDAR